MSGGWPHAKLALVPLLLAHFVIARRWLKGADADRVAAARTLRWFNEFPVLLRVVVVYLVLVKPF